MILRDMTAQDLDAVLAIEAKVHAYPWTRGNFSDALRNGYLCKIAESESGEILGYAIMLPGVEEAELLDIAIARSHQRQGWGKRLLDEMLALARQQNMRRVVLEVRPSNEAALALYRKAGFCEIGLRRAYYPAENGRREDAMLMGRKL